MLIYPLGEPPRRGEVREVVPGVLWMRIGLPIRVNHINVYALDDGDSWTLVDTGMANDDARATWTELLGGPLAGKPVGRLIGTHMHRDHVGLAGWLVERSGAPLWMTALEYAGAVRESSPEAAVLDSRALAFYRAAGWDNEAVSCVRDRLANFADGVYPLPATCRRVVDGEAIRIGGNDWHAVVGRGHSPEHMSLLCPALEVLIAGDQVLPGISTNVSVQLRDADGNPLAHWLESLAKVREAAGDEVIVLPAHGQVFRGLHERIAALIAGYEGTLERLVPALERPQRACDLFPVMFRRPIRPDLVWLASGEALAHLSCLIGRGLVRRNTASDGTEWYVAV